LVAIACGWIGAVELDTLVVVMNLEAMAFMFPLAISISTATLIGNSLGANQPQEAKLFARAAWCIACVFVVIELLVVGTVRQSLAKIYTNDETVITYFHSIAYFLLLFLPCDCIQGVQGGVIRGAGYQAFGAKVNLFSYWVIGFPVGLLLAFKLKIGLPGLLVGLVLAVTTMAVVYTYRINRVNWQEEGAVAQQRIAADQLANHAHQQHSNVRTEDEEFDDADDDGGGDIEMQQPENDERLTQAEEQAARQKREIAILQQSLQSLPRSGNLSPALPVSQISGRSASSSRTALNGGQSRSSVFSIHREEEAVDHSAAMHAVGAAVDGEDFDLDNTEDGMDVESRLKRELGIDAAPSSMHPADETDVPLVPAPAAIAGRSQLFTPPLPPLATRQHYEYVVHEDE
jgi:hypothetical protein